MRSLWSSRCTSRVFIAAVATTVVGLSVFALLDLGDSHPARPLLLLLLLVIFTSASTAIVLFEQRVAAAPRDPGTERGLADAERPANTADAHRRIDA